ncbi:hypothetical protein DCS_06650 [Drechmeria coniospora]|uniref:Uncharacterized protein n=1 Tax=Drechmeria coniospora TaxID=98403 RepID=A0A151GC71_DRECN|nr:hypothetical protein DCS_06650 [Drechmeria coniospora]KYK54690.1 hypothetical protein DCS_06650 [Drechmeria coniospora]
MPSTTPVNNCAGTDDYGAPAGESCGWSPPHTYDLGPIAVGWNIGDCRPDSQRRILTIVTNILSTWSFLPPLHLLYFPLSPFPSRPRLPVASAHPVLPYPLPSSSQLPGLASASAAPCPIPPFVNLGLGHPVKPWHKRLGRAAP